MTKVETSTNDVSTNRGQQQKKKHRRGQKKEKMKPPTKVVVRHLPPTMTEEEFLKQIEMPEHDYFYYASADWSLGNNATCRAYLTLKRYDDVFLFFDRFDGYVFVDSKGAEYSAIVEFSPFQGLLKNRSRRNDSKESTIEQEQHYQQFLVKLEEEREAAAKGSETKLEFTLDRKKGEITSTPLLQYLANKKEKRREEAKKRNEEKRRQREEEKDRRRQAQQQPSVIKIFTAKASGSSTGTDGKSKDGNAAKAAGGSGGGVASGERKNSRAKRNAEREQRRKEQREKAKTNPDEKPEQSNNGKAAGEEKIEKESKRYNEKRERDRDRNRNRKDKEKDKDRERDREKEKQKQDSTSSNVGSLEEVGAVKTKNTDEQISETVRNFIRSVANVTEFVPKHKQKQELDPDPEKQQSEVEVKKDSSMETKTVETEKPNTKKSAAERQKEQQLRREERRIRNKDRPSIAIYTPKPLQRLSSENDSIPNSKDSRSNPPSDCESTKKEDIKGAKKKVSRYSERRSERRAATAISRQKSNDSEDNTTSPLQKSISCEESQKLDTTTDEKQQANDDCQDGATNDGKSSD